MSNNTTNEDSVENRLFSQPEEILFLRLSSAIEAMVFYSIIFNVLPCIIKCRKKYGKP